MTIETIVSQTQSFDPVISNKSKQGLTGKPKRSKHPRLHVKQRKVTHRKDTHNVTIQVEAVPVSQERSGSNNDTRQTAHNEIGDKDHRHPVRDNQPIPGSSVQVQKLLSDSIDSSDDPSASVDKDTDSTNLGANHVHTLNTMSAEGINLYNPGFQYEETISMSISSQISQKIKIKIWRNQFIDLAVLLQNTYTSIYQF